MLLLLQQQHRGGGGARIRTAEAASCLRSCYGSSSSSTPPRRSFRSGCSGSIRIAAGCRHHHCRQRHLQEQSLGQRPQQQSQRQECRRTLLSEAIRPAATEFSKRPSNTIVVYAEDPPHFRWYEKDSNADSNGTGSPPNATSTTSNNDNNNNSDPSGNPRLHPAVSWTETLRTDLPNKYGITYQQWQLSPDVRTFDEALSELKRDLRAVSGAQLQQKNGSTKSNAKKNNVCLVTRGPWMSFLAHTLLDKLPVSCYVRVDPMNVHSEDGTEPLFQPSQPICADPAFVDYFEYWKGFSNGYPRCDFPVLIVSDHKDFRVHVEGEVRLYASDKTRFYRIAERGLEAALSPADTGLGDCPYHILEAGDDYGSVVVNFIDAAMLRLLRPAPAQLAYRTQPVKTTEDYLWGDNDGDGGDDEYDSEEIEAEIESAANGGGVRNPEDDVDSWFSGGGGRRKNSNDPMTEAEHVQMVKHATKKAESDMKRQQPTDNKRRGAGGRTTTGTAKMQDKEEEEEDVATEKHAGGSSSGSSIRSKMDSDTERLLTRMNQQTGGGGGLDWLDDALGNLPEDRPGVGMRPEPDEDDENDDPDAEDDNSDPDRGDEEENGRGGDQKFDRTEELFKRMKEQGSGGGAGGGGGGGGQRRGAEFGGGGGVGGLDWLDDTLGHLPNVPGVNKPAKDEPEIALDDVKEGEAEEQDAQTTRDTGGEGEDHHDFRSTTTSTSTSSTTTKRGSENQGEDAATMMDRSSPKSSWRRKRGSAMDGDDSDYDSEADNDAIDTDEDENDGEEEEQYYDPTNPRKYHGPTTGDAGDGEEEQEEEEVKEVVIPEPNPNSRFSFLNSRYQRPDKNAKAASSLPSDNSSSKALDVVGGRQNKRADVSADTVDMDKLMHEYEQLLPRNRSTNKKDQKDAGEKQYEEN
jgi:hypothetical protein